MLKNERITTDGATVKVKGQDLIVTPKRLTMFLAAIILGLFGALCLFGGLANIGAAFTEGADQSIEIVGLIVVGAGLLGIAYFAFNKGKNQQAVHFDATNRNVQLGSETVPFNDITGVYLCDTGRMSIGDISGSVIQTGIVSNSNTMPIASVSKPKQVDNMSDAAMLIRLYAEHLGYDPKVLGQYEDLLNINLQAKIPVIFPLKKE